MWGFYPLKPPRWPPSALIWEAPGSPKNAPVPPSYSACRARPGRKYSPDLICLAMGYGKLLSYPGRVKPHPARHDPMSRHLGLLIRRVTAP
ncbi:jg24151 [Pararge aegeria aegeria]|uniref:Jg24151 protein n=1 Tax=Pararge aegeria aegeria TaxID=348720 RepID=A0A8S4QZF9_9NEOP|nr:jg24151 [Pararge aegeria aegeria]